MAPTSTPASQQRRRNRRLRGRADRAAVLRGPDHLGDRLADGRRRVGPRRHRARSRPVRTGHGGLATAGLVCSGLGLVVCIVYTAVFSAAVSASTPVATRDYPTAPSVAPSRAPAVTTEPARIGQQVRDGDFAFTVTAVERPGRTLGSGAFASKAQGTWVLVRVTVTNNGDDSGTFSSGKQTLLDAQGREFDADASAAIMNVPDSESFLTTINPGNTVNGTLVFDVPTEVTPAAIELHDSYFSRGVTIAVTR